MLGKVVGDLVTTNYGQRSLTETTMSRHKALIGPRLRACGFTAQQTEAATGVAVQNRMLAMAMIAERGRLAWHCLQDGASVVLGDGGRWSIWRTEGEMTLPRTAMR